jgi:hypothetical protein
LVSPSATSRTTASSDSVRAAHPVAGRRAVEGSDGLVALARPELRHGQVFQSGGQREPSLAGFQDADRLGQQPDGSGQLAGIPGEQATGVGRAGPETWYSRVGRGPPLGGGRRRLRQLAVLAGQRDADQLRIVRRVERKQREEG